MSVTSARKQYQKNNFWYLNYRFAHTTLTQNVSRPVHLIQNKQCAAPIVEQHTRTKTPKNSIVQA